MTHMTEKPIKSDLDQHIAELQDRLARLKAFTETAQASPADIALRDHVARNLKEAQNRI